MIDQLDSKLSFHQSALRVRSQRQELIASNIANADTPGYKAKDVDFAAAMKNAMGGNSMSESGAASVAGIRPAQTSNMHLEGVGGNSENAPGEPLYRKPAQDNLDGNTVDMDVERNQFADNAIRYEASLTMITGQIKEMLAAIQGSA